MMEVNVTIENLTQKHLQAVDPNGKKLEYIYAEGKHGRVLLSEYNCMPTVMSPDYKGETPESYILTIAGDPVSVQMELINEHEMDNDMLTPGFIIALENAKNWCNSWKDQKDTAEIIAKLDRFINHATQLFEMRHPSISSIVIKRNLTAQLARAAADEDKLELRRAVDDTGNAQAMKMSLDMAKATVGGG